MTAAVAGVGYSQPGCGAHDVAHACEGPRCIHGQRYDEQRVLARSVVIDLTDHRQDILVAALRLATSLVETGQGSISQGLDQWPDLVGDCIKGVACEVAYAIWAGIPLDEVGATGKGQPDFWTDLGGIDCKYVKERHGRLAFTVNHGSWLRERIDPNVLYAAISLDGWTATLHGHASTTHVQRWLDEGYAFTREPHYRANGSGYYEVPIYLLARKEAT